MAKHVILLSVDDMIDVVRYRDAFGTEILTPNIDRLMEMGTTYENAMTPVPVCSPARAATVTSQSPFNTGIHQNRDLIQNMVPIGETIFGAAAASGFDTWAEGKMIHGATSASSEAYIGSVFDHVNLRSDLDGGKDAHDSYDRQASKAAADFIRAHDSDSPFFMSLGFMKPHRPWDSIPQKFYDLYDVADIDVPEIEGLGFDDLPLFFQNIIFKELPKSEAKWFGNWPQEILNYLAAVSFADAQIGRVLDALDETGGWDNTTIAFFSDHGYHLGDRGIWRKFTLWEEAASIPMVIVDPDMPRGAVDATPATLLDIWPTLAGLTGLQAPERTDGVDLNTDHGREAVITSAFGSFSVRTEDWRYTLYQDGEEELFNVSDIEHAKPIADPDPRVMADMKAMLIHEAANFGAEIVEIDSRGSAGDDVFVTIGDIEVRGGAGDDVYHITPEAKVIEGADRGHDTVIVSVADGGTYRLTRNVEDAEIEEHAYATLIGNSENNRLKGGEWGDTLKGNRGHDTLVGGEGDDKLVGGNGRDILRGGKDADTFVFSKGHDTVTDYQPSQDVIQDRGHGYRLVQDGDDAIVNWADGQTMTVIDTSINDLEII